MRRKSTRNAQKATPEKTVKDAESAPKTRRSRRRKRSPSKSSESEEEVLTVTKRAPLEATPDTTTKSHTPSDEETVEEPVWKVTSTEDSPKGEIQKLKICLTRPSPDSPGKNKRRSKSNSQTEDDTTSSEDKTSRRTRSQGSPFVRNDGLSSQEGDEDVEEKKGKGKSKGKHKSKIEKSPHVSEPELQTNNEISENVQVTPQSPSIDKPVDNENDHKVDVADIQNVNESVQENENIQEATCVIGQDSDKTATESKDDSQKNESDDDEPLSVVQKSVTEIKSTKEDTLDETKTVQEETPQLNETEENKAEEQEVREELPVESEKTEIVEEAAESPKQSVTIEAENDVADKDSGTVSHQEEENKNLVIHESVERSTTSEHIERSASPKNASPENRERSASPENLNRNASPENLKRNASPENLNRNASPENLKRNASPQALKRKASPKNRERSASPENIKRNVSPQALEQKASPKNRERSASPENLKRNASPQVLQKKASSKNRERSASPDNLKRNASPQDLERNASQKTVERDASPEHLGRNASPKTLERDASPERLGRNSSPKNLERNPSPENLERTTTPEPVKVAHKSDDTKVEGKEPRPSSSLPREETQRNTKERTPRRRLIRNHESLKPDSEENPEEIRPIKPSRAKRKWESDSNLSPSLVKVSLESIQTVWPTIDFPEEPDLNLEVEKERRKSLSESSGKKPERKVSVEYKSDFSERPTFEKQTSTSSTNEDEDKSNIIAFNRKISIVDDTASKLKPPPSPAKNPVSNILYITNLVRPFTVKQLRELLERTGKVMEEGFWTDRIKSKCYVQYETQEEAEVTRNALHGVQWPIGNGKKLMIDYATEEDMQNAKNPPAPPAPAPVPETKVATKENLEPVETKPRVEEKTTKEQEKKREGPVREWDIGKIDVRRERSRSRERGRKHRRSPSPSDDFITRKQRKAEESVPQKLMDDLFLKTKTTPSIYWQPLSPEEISMKQQQRLIRMEEHKRRMEENSRMKGRDIGRGAFRRRYD